MGLQTTNHLKILQFTDPYTLLTMGEDILCYLPHDTSEPFFPWEASLINLQKFKELGHATYLAQRRLPIQYIPVGPRLGGYHIALCRLPLRTPFRVSNIYCSKSLSQLLVDLLPFPCRRVWTLIWIMQLYQSAFRSRWCLLPLLLGPLSWKQTPKPSWHLTELLLSVLGRTHTILQGR